MALIMIMKILVMTMILLRLTFLTDGLIKRKTMQTVAMLMILWFKASVADVLQAEKQEERLMKYIKKYLSVDNLEQYHTDFSFFTKAEW